MPLWQLCTDDPLRSHLCPHVLVCTRHQTLALRCRVENGSRRELPHFKIQHMVVVIYAGIHRIDLKMKTAFSFFGRSAYVLHCN